MSAPGPVIQSGEKNPGEANRSMRNRKNDRVPRECLSSARRARACLRLGLGIALVLIAPVARAGTLLFVSEATTGEILVDDLSTGSRTVAATLTDPRGMTVGPDGNVYVASAGRVSRFDGSTGDFIDHFVPAADPGTIAVAFTPAGDLLTLSNGLARVMRYDGQTGAAAGVFASVEANCVDLEFAPGAGNLFVLSQGGARLLELDPVTGASIGVAYQGPTTDLYGGMAFSSANEVKLTRHDSGGRFIVSVESLDMAPVATAAEYSLYGSPRDLLYDADREILLAGEGNWGRVSRMVEGFPGFPNQYTLAYHIGVEYDEPWGLAIPNLPPQAYTVEVVARSSDACLMSYFAGPAIDEFGRLVYACGDGTGTQHVTRGPDLDQDVVVSANQFSGTSFDQIGTSEDGNVIFTVRVSPPTGGSTIELREGAPNFDLVSSGFGMVGLDRNSSGAYVYRNGSGLLTGPDPVADLFVPVSNGSPVFAPGEPTINESGTILFKGHFQTGGQGLMVGPDPVSDVLVDSLGPYASFGEYPALNDHGEIAFRATLDSGVEGIFTGPDPVVDRVAVDDVGLLFDFGPPVLNDSGRAAFGAFVATGGRGIFDGPDPLANAVVRSGDPIEGQPIHLLFLGREAINDAGQIAFFFDLGWAGGYGFAIATPVPEPMLITGLMIGVGGIRIAEGIGIGRRRRNSERRSGSQRDCARQRIQSSSSSRYSGFRPASSSSSGPDAIPGSASSSCSSKSTS